MKRYKLTALARDDLRDIYLYTRSNWNDEQARRYLKSIEAAYIRFADAPLQSRDYSRVYKGYRAIDVGSHVIFATLEDDVLIVRRVLHKRQDAARQLKPDDPG